MTPEPQPQPQNLCGTECGSPVFEPDGGFYCSEECRDASPPVVWVDIGYGPAEHWVPAEVISYCETEPLWPGDKPSRCANVRLPSGEAMMTFWWKNTNPEEEAPR